MRRNMKGILILVLMLSLSLVTFMGCGKKEADDADQTDTSVVDETDPVEDETEPASTDPLEMISQGYYVYSFFAEGHGDQTYYFNFYEEAPVIGAVFYAGFANNGMTFSGTYTVEEKEYEYATYEDRDAMSSGNDPVAGIAPYTVTFYDWDGSVMDSCGFDGDILYNNMEVIAGAGSSNANYHHDTEGEASKYASTYAGEVGVAYLDFVADEESTSTLTLFHNMTYLDLVDMMVEGTWAMAENAEGGYDYTLTPHDETDTEAVLSVAVDGATATYIPEGGEGVAMTSTLTSAGDYAYLFEGIQTIEAYGADANITLKLYEDGSAELEVEIFGSAGVMDTGTYELDGHTINFNFENAGEIQSELDSETHAVTVHYVQEGSDLGDIDTILTLNQESGSGQASGEVLFSFTGGYTTFDCYTDNTYKFAYADYGLEEVGTWEFDAASYIFSLTQENGNTIEASIGEDHSMSFEYVAVASDQLKDTFTSTSDVWGAALVQ